MREFIEFLESVPTLTGNSLRDLPLTAPSVLDANPEQNVLTFGPHSIVGLGGPDFGWVVKGVSILKWLEPSPGDPAFPSLEYMLLVDSRALLRLSLTIERAGGSLVPVESMVPGPETNEGLPLRGLEQVLPNDALSARVIGAHPAVRFARALREYELEEFIPQLQAAFPQAFKRDPL